MMDLQQAHLCSSGHETALKASTMAGCFYCLALYPASEITEWCVDPPTMGLGDGRTAICPRCGIDSVLPDAMVPLSETFLKRMKKEWF